MKCNNCGVELGANDVFCPNCGTPVKENANNKTMNSNMYTYENPTNQQYNYNQQQMQNTVQQNYIPNNTQQPNQNHNNNNRTIKICVVAIIGIAILVAIIFMIYSLMVGIRKNANVNENEEINNNTNTENTNNEEINNSTIINDILENNNISNNTINNNTVNENTSTNNTTSSYKVNYKGVKFYIPDNLIYQADSVNDTLNIMDENQTWAVQLTVVPVPFSQIKAKKSTLATSFSEKFSVNGAKFSNATVETVDGVEFVILEAEIAGSKMIFGYTGINSMYTVGFTLINEDNDFNKEYLKNIATIVKKAEYTGEVEYLKPNEAIKVEELIETLKSAVENN